MSMDSDIIRGHVDTIILKTLISGDKYGYEIIKEIDEKSNGSFELKQPTLYSCLKRLEQQGLISAYWINSDIGGKRHYYKLTKKGRNQYENHMKDWYESRNVIDSLMGSSSQKDTTMNVEKTIDFSENIDSRDVDTKDMENNEDIEQHLEPVDENRQKQLVFEDNAITQDDEENLNKTENEIDYNNTSLDEEDYKMVGDYYKVDENQIDLFGNEIESSIEPGIESNIEIESDSPPLTNLSEDSDECVETNKETTQDEDETPVETTLTEQTYFSSFSGANVSHYKPQNTSDYFTSIRSLDETNIYPVSNKYEENCDNNLKDIHENIEETETILENTNNDNIEETPSKINYFGFSNSSSEDEKENEQNDLNDTEEDDNNSYNYFSNKLNFGSNYEDDNEEDEVIPNSFSGIKDLDESQDEYVDDDGYDNFETESQNEGQRLHILGEEFEEDNEENFDDYPTETSTTENWQDNKTELYEVGEGYHKSANINPTFTETNVKEKLNSLSSFVSPKVENQPKMFTNETNQNQIKSIDEIKDEFDSVGIKVHIFEQKQKQPVKEKSYLLANKIKFTTSWIVFGIVSVLLGLSLILANGLNYLDLSNVTSHLPSFVYYIIAEAVALILPIVYTVYYLLDPKKKIKPNYSPLISFIFSLLFFVVCLNIIYTYNILNGFTKFSQIDYNHLLWLLPSIDASLIVVQSIVYTVLYKSKKFMA